MKEKPYHHGQLRSRLIEAGIELINEEGLKGFSLRKVASRCQVSHTAPYSHFEDMTALIQAMGQHVTEQFMESLHEALEQDATGSHAISKLGQAYIDFFIKYPHYFQFLFYHSGMTVDLDQEREDEYPPFALFRNTAYATFRRAGLPPEQDVKNLISLWSMVHGIASLLTNEGIRYSGDWREVFAGCLMGKEEKR